MKLPSSVKLSGPFSKSFTGAVSRQGVRWLAFCIRLSTRIGNTVSLVKIAERYVELYDELLDEGYVNHDFPSPRPGVEGFKTVVQMFKAAFADCAREGAFLPRP